MLEGTALHVREAQDVQVVQDWDILDVLKLQCVQTHGRSDGAKVLTIAHLMFEKCAIRGTAVSKRLVKHLFNDFITYKKA